MNSENTELVCPGSCTGIRSPHEPHNARAALLPRRSFVKTIGLLTAASWLGGKEIQSLLVTEVQAQSQPLAGVFQVSLDSLTVLKNQLGSVLVKVTGMPAAFPRIIITREGDTFHAVSSRCTHEGSTVSPFNAALGAMRCPQHGSRFSPDGKVLLGPAIKALDRYETNFDGAGTLTIDIPGLGFNITTAAVLHPTTGADRLRIEFPSVTGVRYGVRFRPSLVSGTWAMIPFSTTIDGAAATNELTGNNGGKTIFVDRQESLGFYAVTRTS